MKLQRYVIIPDLQIPHHDKKYAERLMDVVINTQPAGVIFIGDNVDCTAPAVWNKGTAEEFAGTLQNEFDVWFDLGTHLRSGYDGFVGVHFGNHEKRITRYLKDKAPALSSLRSLRLENLMRLDELGFTGLPDHYDIAPGWVTHHGDYASLSDIAGRSASNYSSKIGKSVIMGHTHRAGIVPESYGYNSRWKWRYGMEVGHGMDTRKAGYTNGVANWQKAFGTLDVWDKGKYISPSLTFARPDGTFIYEGVIYGNV
ncbi:MAG: hypothetical protein ABW007_27725 [Chitinophagaceae bacterium]